MSRHVFPGHTGATSVAIGYDRPLETFFVQVFRPHATLDGEEDAFIWRGGNLRELRTAAAAIEIARPWTTLPPDFAMTLETDRMKTSGTPDGEAQRVIKQRFLSGNASDQQ